MRLDGAVDSGTFGTRNTFAANPDLPVRSFKLEFDGGRPDALLALTQDLCAKGSDLTMSVKLTAYNGKESAFEQELATPGCDPRANVSVKRRGKLATLVAKRDRGARRSGRDRHHREAAEGPEARQARGDRPRRRPEAPAAQNRKAPREHPVRRRRRTFGEDRLARPAHQPQAQANHPDPR